MTTARDIAYRHGHGSGKFPCVARDCTTRLTRVRTRPPCRCTLITAGQQTDFAVIGGGPGGLACAAALKVALGNVVHVKVRQANRRLQLLSRSHSASHAIKFRRISVNHKAYSTHGLAHRSPAGVRESFGIHTARLGGDLDAKCTICSASY